MTHPDDQARPLIAMALSLAMVVALMAGFAVTRETGLADPDIAKRGAAAMLGLILVVTGNFVPKMRLFQTQGGGGAAVDRFAGWVFVLAGLAFSAVWLFGPLERAALASPMIGVAGFLLVLARWLAWRRTQKTGGPVPALTPGRAVIALLLVSVLWTCAIFFADAVWGDTVAQWMAIIFTIALGGLGPLLIVLLRGHKTVPRD